MQEKARIIKADLLLQAKVGMGVIEDEKIQKMQKVMDETKVDFAPMAHQYLTELATAIDRARKGEDEPKMLIAQMTPPVMQIKANAAMFNYPLAGNLANIVLNFLENATGVDKTMLDMMDAHRKILSVIVRNKKSRTDGDYGQKIETELKQACKRYFSNRGKTIAFVE